MSSSDSDIILEYLREQTEPVPTEQIGLACYWRTLPEKKRIDWCLELIRENRIYHCRMAAAWAALTLRAMADDGSVTWHEPMHWRAKRNEVGAKDNPATAERTEAD